MDEETKRTRRGKRRMAKLKTDSPAAYDFAKALLQLIEEGDPAVTAIIERDRREMKKMNERRKK